MSNIDYFLEAWNNSMQIISILSGALLPFILWFGLILFFGVLFAVAISHLGSEG